MADPNGSPQSVIGPEGAVSAPVPDLLPADKIWPNRQPSKESNGSNNSWYVVLNREVQKKLNTTLLDEHICKVKI